MLIPRRGCASLPRPVYWPQEASWPAVANRRLEVTGDVAGVGQRPAPCSGPRTSDAEAGRPGSDSQGGGARRGRGLCVKSTAAREAEESGDLLRAKLGPTLGF